MINEFRYNGEWFLPSDESKKVSGTLTFDTKSDAVLELHGTFNEDFDDREERLILGFTTTGEYITLYRSYQYFMNMTNGVMTTKYHSLYVINGIHCTFEEDLVFTKIETKFKGLDNWIGKYGFKIQNKRADQETNILYKKPEDITFKINEKISGKLVFNFSFPIGEKTSKMSITQSTSLLLISKDPIPLIDFLDVMALFQNFLTMATFDTAYPTANRIVYTNPDGTEFASSLVFKPLFNYVPADTLYRKLFLFSFSDIESNFETIIQNWFSLNGSIDPVMNLLFDSFYNPEKAPENRLLNIVQAMETFHRLLKTSPLFPMEEYKSWAATLVDQVDPKYKDLLKGKLNFANEPTLHNRLEDLINSVVNIETVKKVVGDQEQFIRDTKNTRNYYTHYDKRLEKKALKGAELMFLSQKLRLVLIAVVLIETGFKHDEINLLLKKIERMFFNHLIKEKGN